MCTTTTNDICSSPVRVKAPVQRRDDSVRNLNISANLKDLELGPLLPSGSQDSSSSESSQASAVSWLSLKAVTNGKVLYACTLYSFCSVSMVLTNKSLASRYVVLTDSCFVTYHQTVCEHSPHVLVLLHQLQSFD